MEEEWKKIEGHEKYLISTKGRVYSTKTNVYLKPRPNKAGYLKVHLWDDSKRKSYFIHRLVAIAFIENPQDKEQVNHENGIKTDNRVENLSWMTCSENVKHSYDTGLTNLKNKDYTNIIKANKKRRVFSKKDVEKVLELSKTLSSRKIAKIMGTSKEPVLKVIKGEYFK